jgi:hypothetical protein
VEGGPGAALQEALAEAGLLSAEEEADHQRAELITQHHTVNNNTRSPIRCILPSAPQSPLSVND